LLLLLLNTTRIRSGPPSTRASIAVDGGVALIHVKLTSRFSAAFLHRLAESTERSDDNHDE